MLWIAIIIFCIAADQASKYFIVNNIEYHKSTAVIDQFFYITNIRNTGAAWSILENGRYFFLILTPIIVAVLAYFLYKMDSRLLRTALSLIIGGAAGNFIDRLLIGSVVDFLEFHFGTYIFPIFNIADCCVVIGSFLLAYYLLFIYKEKPGKGA
ncbi:signal peptidase II [Anaerobacterium chartisolvens]|uniref:Lipoprotein signal peptidase n=1 Tax=Anaerobacterium chartisolvens TaxID=1297424 RepID=A0A369B6H9_9FIRM|nr:signal peptidase II [Anaerobacterium chartisolvens]RCX17120.1 signal peptidase II [Anaerobacterium chartisolvens]